MNLMTKETIWLKLNESMTTLVNFLFLVQHRNLHMYVIQFKPVEIDYTESFTTLCITLTLALFSLV